MILMDGGDNVKYVYKIPILMSWKNNENHGSALAKWHSLVKEKDEKSLE